MCRDTLLLDAYEEVMSCSARDLRKMAITVSFYGEEGYVCVYIMCGCACVCVCPWPSSQVRFSLWSVYKG